VRVILTGHMQQVKVHKMHRLKTLPQYFREIENGNKTFELRLNDRNFQLGDMLILQEYNLDKDELTGNQIMRIISYIMPGNQFVIWIFSLVFFYLGSLSSLSLISFNLLIGQ